MISVFGLGFVGLTTALGLCEVTRNKVYGFDIDESRLSSISNKLIPFFEPGLDEALEIHMNNHFFLTQTEEEAVNNSNIMFICVGTPCDASGTADLSILAKAVSTILETRRDNSPYTLVVKSTVPPGTVSDIVAPLCIEHGKTPGKDIFICSNPEFLREGFSWDDFINPDRVVIGEYTSTCGNDLAKLYESFNAPIVRVNSNTAEFIKYASNTLLATMISFSNELAMVADAIGEIQTAKAFETLHMDKRWVSNNSDTESKRPANMSSYAFPGCGFGGYCLPKDTSALAKRALSSGYETTLLNEVLNVNEKVKRHTAENIIEMAGKTNNTVGILGLSFKAGSDDVRNSPTADIIEMVCDAKVNVIAYDPMSIESFSKLYNLPIKYVNTGLEVIRSCKTIAILTGWPEFKELDYSEKNLIDARYLIR